MPTNGSVVLDTNIAIGIAALTQQYGAAIATRDQHFDAVEHLEVVRW
jgi:predicted nucleic acid-binding protein